jgi:hypothetical protein
VPLSKQEETPEDLNPWISPSNKPVIIQKVFTTMFNLIKYEHKRHAKQLATYPGCKYASYHVQWQLRNDHVDTSLLESS